MLSTTDRRALGAMGYFAVETATLKPMVAAIINNVHRNVHEMIQSGMDPMVLWKTLMEATGNGHGHPAEPEEPEPITPCPRRSRRRTS